MIVFDSGDATLWARLLAGLVAFLVLAAIAAATLVGAMTMVLFSADGAGASDYDRLPLNRTLFAIVISLAVAVILPPILLICRASTVHSAIPAGLGFACAGIATMWHVMVALGAK